jgi:hypothetical protein
MRSRFVAAALITAVLLSGCSSESNMSTQPAVDEIDSDKQAACSMFNDTLKVLTPDGYRIAGMESTDLFNKLAKSNPEYTPYAELVALISITDFRKSGIDAGLIAIAKVKVFCS